MNKFFNYYNSLCVGANSPNVFSFDPYFVAIKEMLVAELRQIVFYIEKLKELDIDMSVYRDKVIEFISVLIVNLDFKRESFFVIVSDLYENKTKLHEMYNSICKEKNIQPQKLDVETVSLSDKNSIIKALNEYEKNVSVGENSLSVNKKVLYQIMVNLVLNACNCLIDLKNYNYDYIEAKEQVLKLFNVSNFPSSDDKQWIKIIKDFSKCNYSIMKKLQEKIVENFGPIEKSIVPFAIKKGKAILVSGYNYSDLEKILNCAGEYDINVYTHHEMINAFKYKKLKNHPNLAGHFQRSSNNFSLDFSSFSGPIYISRNSMPKIDVIRGQIYTSAKYPSYGIAKIENNDFTPLINYALNSKGFDEDNVINTLDIGYNEAEINLKTDKIIKLYNDKKITHITFICQFDKFTIANEYIDKFLRELPENFYAITFAPNECQKNVWKVNSFYDVSLTYKILERLISQIDKPSENISIFLMDCNSNTLSHIFNLIHLGIEKIFLGACCPNILNPILIEGLEKMFSVSELTVPQKDIQKVKTID